MAKRTNSAMGAIAPHQRNLSSLHAAGLGASWGLSASEIEGRTVAELCDTYRFLIDAELFLRTICGREGNLDSAIGSQFPVPLVASLHDEDADCRLVGAFAKGWNGAYSFKLMCRRGAICGRRVVWADDRVPSYLPPTMPVAIVQ